MTCIIRQQKIGNIHGLWFSSFTVKTFYITVLFNDICHKVWNPPMNCDVECFNYDGWNHKRCIFPNLPVNVPPSYVLNLSCQSTNFLDNPFFNLLAYLHVHVAFTVNVNITFGDVFFEAPLVVESLHGNDYQIKSTLNNRTSKKECQILYMLNIIHLQFMSSFDEHLYA